MNLISKKLEEVSMDVGIQKEGNLTFLYVDNWFDGCPALSVFENAPYVDINMELSQIYRTLQSFKISEGWIYNGTGPLNYWGSAAYIEKAREWIASLGYAITEENKEIHMRTAYHLKDV